MPVAGSHTSPGAQVTPLHWLQSCCVQAPPAGAQMPQDGLQQYSPAPHIELPQLVPVGTH